MGLGKMSGNRKQVILKTSADQKSKWKRYANNHHRSLSDLIRYAVEKEIARDDDPAAGSGQEDVANQLSDITDQLQELTTRLSDLDTRLQAIEQEVAVDKETEELANDVFALLPESEEEILEAEHQSLKGEEIPPERRAQSGRVADIAQALDVGEYRIHDALTHLQTSMNRVQVIEFGDEQRFYKEV
ncbi:hypothetical protein [Halomicrococcus gelatinilyticus]|uniref:hypothetical protein n=1 Tax=Halomicrococcus gelatinilyticus TaxID=1702103 RepID=UPI002E10C0C4